MDDVELLSPAGSFDTALAAFEAGADAVYLGLDAFSARAEAANFSTDELRRLIAYAHGLPSPRRVYVAFNTVVDDGDVAAAIEKLAILDDLRPDGVIVQDLGVARLARRHFPALPLHASTQLVAHNLEDVCALRDFGFVRVVLARELTLEEIASLVRRADGMEFEVFVHGALCYSISGLCLFSAMERSRSGNRGRCAYCCRLPYTDASGETSLPFSMRDLRLDESLDALREAGVASLKIEGRMKSSVYVASVTRRYRELLDGIAPTTSRADLETVFSRRTTTLYLGGRPDGGSPKDVIDKSSLGHLGTPIGTVKRITRDREGRSWLRFHTNRAIEKHDGLQFALPGGGKPAGFGISAMRLAISRSPAFSAPADSDVEVLVPETETRNQAIHSGAVVYCSASNEVRRRFPTPSFRPSDVQAGTPIDLVVTLAPQSICVAASAWDVRIEHPIALSAARQPERTQDAVRNALSRLGGTDWSLGETTVHDPDSLFAPASALNDIRRRLVEMLDDARAKRRREKIAAALADTPTALSAKANDANASVIKIRLGQVVEDDMADFDEIVVHIGHHAGREAKRLLMDFCTTLRSNLMDSGGDSMPSLRLALPAFTPDAEFGALRAAVKHLVEAGFMKWEAADLATLRMLTSLGIDDITADWTLYAFNRHALAQLSEMGVRRFVASPENTRENMEFLAASGFAVEFLAEQSTPLFLSLTKPAAADASRLTGARGEEYAAYRVDNLWTTVRAKPNVFRTPVGASMRIDRSWDANARRFGDILHANDNRARGT